MSGLSTLGKRKISRSDQHYAVELLNKWPAKKALNWEDYRVALAAKLKIKPQDIWSRQALSRNEAISSAFKVCKQRAVVARSGYKHVIRSADAYIQRIQLLEVQLAALKKKHALLLLRHTRLAYNASLLPGGTALLQDTLPNNTRSQS